jgi:hypothetical protein
VKFPFLALSFKPNLGGCKKMNNNQKMSLNRKDVIGKVEDEFWNNNLLDTLIEDIFSNYEVEKSVTYENNDGKETYGLKLLLEVTNL